MIELRWNGRVLEQRFRHVTVDWDMETEVVSEWSEWHPVPTVPKPDGEPPLPHGITYGGCEPGGEYYSKPWRNDSYSLWTKGDESWTASELRAIADHQDWIYGKSEIEPIVGANIPEPFRSDL